jgi:hypothetical protein
VHNGLGYVAGHGPFDGSTTLDQALIGRDLTVEQGYDAARLTVLVILASLKRVLGALDRAPDCGQNATVANGFNELIVELWGEAGRHALRARPGAVPAERPDHRRRDHRRRLID